MSEKIETQKSASTLQITRTYLRSIAVERDLARARLGELVWAHPESTEAIYAVIEAERVLAAAYRDAADHITGVRREAAGEPEDAEAEVRRLRGQVTYMADYIQLLSCDIKALSADKDALLRVIGIERGAR